MSCCCHCVFVAAAAVVLYVTNHIHGWLFILKCSLTSYWQWCRVVPYKSVERSRKDSLTV